MKKIVIMFPLLVSTHVLAEWTEFGGKPDVGMTTYADFNLYEKMGIR